MFYAALDVSLRSVAICIIDDAGKVRLERSTLSELPDLIRCLQTLASRSTRSAWKPATCRITSPPA
jgi:hypothetical protein